MALALKERLARQAAGGLPLTFDSESPVEPQLVSLPLECIEPDPNQPRKDLGDLAELAASIQEQGLVSPLIVEPLAPGRYRLLAGERRHAACRVAALSTAPCIVRTVAEQSRLALQLVENLHRKDLHPLEEAMAFKRLMDETNLTQRDLAQRVGKSLSSVNETLRILDISPEVLADIRTSEHATKSVLLAIAKETDPVRQQALWTRVQTGQLTVRQVRVGKQPAKSVKSHGAVVTIPLPEATLVIRFRSGEASSERVLESLEQALAVQRAQS